MATARRTFVLTAARATSPLALLVVLAVLAAPACHRSEAPGAPGLVDEVGRRVTPRHVPTRRVVSLAPNITELLFAIGAGAQIVALDNYSDQPAARVEHLARVGTDYDPSLESIVRLEPDVVLTSLSANRRETVEALDRLGVAVFVTDTATVSDVDRTLTNLGALTGHPREATAQIRSVHDGLDAVRRRVAGAPRPGVLVAVWDDPLYVAGRGTFTHDLIEIAGGTNVAADAVGFAKYPLERVLRAGPAIIVRPTHAPETSARRAITYWSRWTELPAVRDGRIHGIEDALIIRPGPRLAEAAALLAGLIHPERPPSPPGRSAARRQVYGE